jgi:hypothetical protein
MDESLFEDSFNLDNIVDIDDVQHLIDDAEDDEADNNADDQAVADNDESNEESNEAPDQEKVGNEEETDEIDQDEENTDEGQGDPNFYSSIANALAEEGVFQSLDSDIKSADDFKAAIENEIANRFNDRQKRIDEALSNGVQPDLIKQFESTINYLSNVTEESLEDESEQSENLRKQLIYQDYINRGYTKERAQKEVKKSIDAGTDIEDAKDALESNLDYYNKAYRAKIDINKAEIAKQQEENRKNLEAIQKSIMNDNDLFGGVEMTKQVRQNVYNNIFKQTVKDDNGNYVTPIQEYERKNKLDFIKNVGIAYTLTNGFKDFSGLYKQKVNKEVKKGLRSLESKLKHQSGTSFDGNLAFVNKNDDESFIGAGWQLDI